MEKKIEAASNGKTVKTSKPKRPRLIKGAEPKAKRTYKKRGRPRKPKTLTLSESLIVGRDIGAELWALCLNWQKRGASWPLIAVILSQAAGQICEDTAE